MIGIWRPLPVHQPQRLEQFVERAVAARQRDVGAREFREHHLAREEMLEAQADVPIDVESDRHATALEGALVVRLHQSGTAAGENGEPGLREQPRGLFREPVVERLGFHARAAQHADRGPHAGEALGRLEELCHNAEQLPRLARGDLVAEAGRLQ
jgi:hypothetical protein